MSTKNEQEATDKEGSTTKAESPSEQVDPPKLENFYHLTSMGTWSYGGNENDLTDHGLFEDPADARAIARTDLKRSVDEYDCLILGENAKFTMEQYLRGVLGAEKDIRCRDELWQINERLEKDGSRLIEFEEVECDGPQYCLQYRIKKYKMPKITRKRKATTEVPLAETPTGLTSNIN